MVVLSGKCWHPRAGFLWFGFDLHIFANFAIALLFIEICDRYGKDAVGKLSQYLGALMLQKGADKLKGVLIGRFFKDEAVIPDDIKAVLLSREDLKDIPIIVNVDFGHTTPMVTLPVGGRISILKDQIIISEH